MRLNIKASYKEVDKVDISYSKYSNIIQLFMKHIIELVLQGNKVYLPERMGSIQVIGKKQEYKIDNGIIKGLAPDWKATKEYRLSNPNSTKVIFHTNTDTEGIKYKIKWSKFNVFAKNKNYYWLRFTRNVKRTLSSYIKENKYEYQVL